LKYVAPLSEAELITLRQIHENHPSRRVRMRGLALVLSHDGYRIGQIADIFDVRRQTISSWIESWEKKGLPGLYDWLGT
jgi:transposase